MIYGRLKKKRKKENRKEKWEIDENQNLRALIRFSHTPVAGGGCRG